MPDSRPLAVVTGASTGTGRELARQFAGQLAHHGTTVALLPGPADTEFFARARMQGTPVDSSSRDDPADVAKDGFEALMAGESQVVAGSVKNKARVAGARLMPDQARAAGHAKLTRPEDR